MLMQRSISRHLLAIEGSVVTNWREYYGTQVTISVIIPTYNRANILIAQ